MKTDIFIEERTTFLLGFPDHNYSSLGVPFSGGQAKTLMFVHISPEPDAIGETISTLKFAERVATVELGAARVNKDSSDVKELKEQVFAVSVTLFLPCDTSLII